MNYVAAILRALVTLDGEALVLHPGDKPFVVAAPGPVELSTRPLTILTLRAVLTELLPPDTLATLETVGAVQWELSGHPATDPPTDALVSGDRFVVVAARVDNEPWVEVRRYKRAPADARPREARGHAEDSLTVPSADEFWPTRADDEIDDSF